MRAFDVFLNYNYFLKNILFFLLITLVSEKSFCEAFGRDLETKNNNLRIVSYSPALTEILFALGLGDSIVGTTTFSDVPEKAKKIPLVGSYFRPSIEKTLQLNPTHVLVMKEGDETILEFLKKSKLNFVVFESRSLKNYKDILLQMGALFDVKTAVAKLINEFERETLTLPKLKKSIAILVDDKPVIFAGRDTFLSEALSLCGLKNVFEFSGYQKVSAEILSSHAPEVLLTLRGHEDSKKLAKEDATLFLNRVSSNKNPFLEQTKIISEDANALSRLGPRLMLSIRRVCETASHGNN